MAMEECPIISETILGLTFLDRSSVAQVCRRSWKRMFGSSALSRSGLNEVLAKLGGTPVNAQLTPRLEYLFVRELGPPSVGREDRLIDPGVGVLEPRRALVVEVGEPTFL